MQDGAKFPEPEDEAVQHSMDLVHMHMEQLRKYRPELGIWTGYRTPEPKTEAVTKEEVEEEERRERMTPREIAEEDAAKFANKPEIEVKHSLKLPGPLIWKPPLDSEWVIDERAREGKAKATRATELGQKAAQKRSDKLADAAKRGFNVGGGGNSKRPINYNGIYCTKSMTTKCADIGLSPEMAMQCNAKLQECHFKSPLTNRWEIAEPVIPCPNGKYQCMKGVLAQEAERWFVLHQQHKKESFNKADILARKARKIREDYAEKIKAKGDDDVSRQTLEMNWQMTKAAVKFNRPGGKYKPQPSLDIVPSQVGAERRKTMQMRQKLGAVNKLLQKLGILTLGCGANLELCMKRCDDPNRAGIRLDPDGTKCRSLCNKEAQMCMVRKVQMATAAAKRFEQGNATTTAGNVTRS